MKQSSVWWQYLLPQHLLSRWMGRLAHSRCKKFKNWAITAFTRHYGVNLNESAIEDIRQFQNFNDFFTRKLKPDARPIATDPAAIISPVDGCISEIGKIEAHTILQAKKKFYSLTCLFGGDEALANNFMDGSFMTAYLAPKDYHRIHMPFDGQLVSMRYIPGKLFSVNTASASKINDLFARNERLVCVFDSSIGPFVVIAVGAMIVGSIVTAWHGVVNEGHSDKVSTWNYADKSIRFCRGDELGYFQLGSTVILLFARNAMAWNAQLKAGLPLQVGQMIAKIKE